ncbi:PepSY-associated TM helix domain-containing protein [Parasphingorhabdus sp.]|uniref:PepSY-associated TM helix domain-containing protein n=1 Tax=Parasphingorhabdus sp. TaxID=2709688 RepID=UPI002F948721
MSDPEAISLQRTLSDGQANSAIVGRKRKKRVSSFWVKQLHTWHWMSSAICLIGMLLFAITGITLNHAGAIEGAPQVQTVEKELPAPLLDSISEIEGGDAVPVPGVLNAWAQTQLEINLSGRPVEWSDDEIYVALPKPGGDGWVSFDRINGAVIYEATDRGWISWLNDLHKGRDTGAAWSWFIDIFAVACIIFCLTGFFLLQLHARHRPSTWPIVGAGLILPLLLIILFMHS